MRSTRIGSRFLPVRLAIAFVLLAVGIVAINENARAFQQQRAESSETQRAQDVSVGPADGYAELANHLSQIIERELADKGIPSLAIAITDDEQVLWAQAFGTSDAVAETPATVNSIYRVGSVSKLFTDIAVMRLVEQGELDLDAPVNDYIPEFQPENSYGDPITLRQLMSHRSGLVREPPVGHYFDPEEPTLAETVASLNNTALVLKPGEKTKYSNAGIAVVGYVLERTQRRPFVEYLQEELLRPLGMNSSSFVASREVNARRAHAIMWGYDRREFAAPTFELGTAPAGSMYTTVLDLSLFSQALLQPGKVVQAETLREMWTPQFARDGATEGFGLGFLVSQLEGHKTVSHGGAIYGYSTEWSLMPDEKLGVVAVASKDVTNSLVEKIVTYTQRCLLAQKANEPLPEWKTSSPVGADRASELAGKYTAENGTSVELLKQGDELYLWRDPLYYRIRQDNEPALFVADDAHVVDTKVSIASSNVEVGGRRYDKQPSSRPAEPPAEWQGLIGEYGWDHNVLFIHERDGQLYALIEWVFAYPLEQVDDNTFNFPNYGLYHDEQLIFERDEDNQATQVTAAEVVFKRRDVGTAAGETFKIEPVRPVEEMRNVALAASPPEETPPSGGFRQPDLVELRELDDTIKYDIRYASDNNFMGATFYKEPHAFMQRPAAEALVKAHQKLKERGYGILVHDAYRPWYVTKMFWDATPQAMKNFVADPSQGSRHNRGCAVDVTLYDLATGEPITMVSGYDEFTERAFPEYPGGTSSQRYHRELLRNTIEAEGFTVYEHEWWHFDYKDWTQYPIMAMTFDAIMDEN